MPERVCEDCKAVFSQRTGRPAKRCAPCRSEFGRRRAAQWAKDNAARKQAKQKELRSRHRAKNEPCSVEGCTRPSQYAEANQHCTMHRYRLKRHGDVGAAEPQRQERDNLTPEGYRRFKVKGRLVLEHRAVVETALGRPLEKWENVHHINGIRHDNRLENLEVWITPQPRGQRPEDLAEWIVRQYPDLVQAALNGEPRTLL